MISVDSRHRSSAGRDCWVEEVQWDGEVVRARFVGSVNDVPTPVESGTAYLSAWPTDRPEAAHVSSGETGSDGRAFLPLAGDLLGVLHRGESVECLVARAGDHLFARAVSPVTALA